MGDVGPGSKVAGVGHDGPGWLGSLSSPQATQCTQNGDRTSVAHGGLCAWQQSWDKDKTRSRSLVTAGRENRAKPWGHRDKHSREGGRSKLPNLPH